MTAMFEETSVENLRRLKKGMRTLLQSYNRSVKLINAELMVLDRAIKEKEMVVSPELVSEHAAFRWMERVHKIDTDKIRQEIADALRGRVTGIGVEHFEHPETNMLICVVDGTVTTVLDRAYELPEQGELARPSILKKRQAG